MEVGWHQHGKNILIYLLCCLACNQPQNLIPKTIGRTKTKPTSHSGCLNTNPIKCELVLHFCNLTFKECSTVNMNGITVLFFFNFSFSIIIWSSFRLLCVYQQFGCLLFSEYSMDVSWFVYMLTH